VENGADAGFEVLIGYTDRPSLIAAGLQDLDGYPRQKSIEAIGAGSLDGRFQFLNGVMPDDPGLRRVEHMRDRGRVNPGQIRDVALAEPQGDQRSNRLLGLFEPFYTVRAVGRCCVCDRGRAVAILVATKQIEDVVFGQAQRHKLANRAARAVETAIGFAETWAGHRQPPGS
jgi:hypothetical protein